MSIFKLALFAACVVLSGLTAGQQSTFSPAQPPAIPLAVKSPYLNTWLYDNDDGNGGNLAGQWSQFWAGQVTAWTGMIRVDGTTYTWMGAPGPKPVIQKAFQYTSTSSIFTMDVGGSVEMNITFTSPITPDDMKRQSLLFSYLNVEVTSLDGNPHHVQLYTDISAEWVAGDHGSVAQWDYGVTSDKVAYHKIHRETQLAFDESFDQANWGNWYYSTANSDNLSFQSGSDKNVRGDFQTNGKLGNSKDTTYRPINQDWPVFGFSSDFGSIHKETHSTLYTIGLAQEKAIQFNGASGIVPLPSLWSSYFSSEDEAVGFFYNDYGGASRTARGLDNKIARDSLAAGGQNYLTATSLATRQAFGALQLVGDSTKQYLFLKEISSNGNTQTVDVVFPFHPILLYLNPELLKLMLDPLFENQESGHYPNKYSIHDLGTHYPNATGYTDGGDEAMPLEECGNMLVMTLVYAQRTKNKDYLKQHYKMLDQWAQYLIDEALIPAKQISTDDFAGPLENQTNLALKGMIGIQAMAIIANLTGDTATGANYTNIASSYIDQWQTLGVAHDADPPHTTLSYGSNDTHGLLYNIYCDKLLATNLVPQKIYDMQSAFYPTIMGKYGVPLDTRHAYTKSDWEIFVAAVASQSTKDMFLGKIASWISETPTNRAMTDLYEVPTGSFPGGLTFTARPVVGGFFALLALKGASSEPF
ncbi:Glutaminase GtaA [Venustampulla echinocandica]|uniref:Glutaminase GtaA n=1 Tax=Venustampulla echinocandica TaxID=2656787 RepID=A0A370TF42_9HELO|nr:Glutaminase GtaA [Venustampulla echinocandica]RDL33306.1 Glutaminase GtaA [Venustampulla echinocandica]